MGCGNLTPTGGEAEGKNRDQTWVVCASPTATGEESYSLGWSLPTLYHGGVFFTKRIICVGLLRHEGSVKKYILYILGLGGDPINDTRQNR